MIFGSFVHRSWAAATVSDPILAMFGSDLIAYHAPESIQISGSTVTGWRDLSGRGNHLEVLSGNPTLSTLNGRPAVECEDARIGQVGEVGGGIAAAVHGDGIDTPFSIIQWAQIRSVGATLWLWNFADSQGQSAHRMWASTEGYIRAIRRNISGYSNTSEVLYPHSSAHRLYAHVYGGIASPGNLSRVDTIVVSHSTWNAQNLIIDGFQIGRVGSAQTPNILRFSHNIVVGRAVSSSEIDAVVAYLEGS